MCKCHGWWVLIGIVVGCLVYWVVSMIYYSSRGISPFKNDSTASRTVGTPAITDKLVRSYARDLQDYRALGLPGNSPVVRFTRKQMNILRK